MSTAVRNEHGLLLGEVIVTRTGRVIDATRADSTGTYRDWIGDVTKDGGWFVGQTPDGTQHTGFTRREVLEYLWTKHQEHLESVDARDQEG